MNEEVLKEVSKELNIEEYRVKNVIKMLSEGSTIPFIARYRKELTGNLDEESLRDIESKYNYNYNLNNRKADVKRLIDEKGMLTDELVKAIDECKKLNEVEDIYLPFKEKRKTKGTEAIKLGLEPLAKEIMKFTNKTEEELATPYLNENVKTVEDAIINAGYIIADLVADNPKYRKWIRNYYYNNGIVKSTKKKNDLDKELVYEMYYNFEQKITEVKSYRIFAIARAAKEGIVNYSLKVGDSKILEYLNREVMGNTQFVMRKRVESFILDSYKRLIEPSLERDIKSELFDIASDLGIKEFGNNLENLLLTPPIKQMVVMGFDPAFRTGCKLAIVNEFGDVLDIGVIYPHEPKKLVAEAKEIMLDLISKFDVKVIAIGNGTASRESEQFVSSLIKENNLDVKFIVVNEAGASVYSALLCSTL